MPKKKTHEEFLEEMELMHPEIAVLGNYVNASTRISVKCRTCGHQWNPIPSSLVNTGTGCPSCARVNRAKAQTMSHDAFLTKMAEKGIAKVVPEGTYENTEKHITFRCLVCGNRWDASPQKILQGRGCPKCSKHHKRSHAEFVNELKSINPSIKVLGTFEKVKAPIQVQCKECGFIWETKAVQLLQGCGCAKCSGNYRMSHEEFVERMADVNSEIEIVGKYENQSKPVKARCRICGGEWTPIPNNLLRGSRCPKCSYALNAKKRSMGDIEFASRLKEINPEIKILGKYTANNKKIEVSCQRCGHRWSTVPSTLLSGHGCPACAATSTSFMEQFLLLALRKAIGSEEAVLSRDKSLIGMELDIALPNYGIAIEPGSWFWHKDKLDNDREKRAQCEERGIRLITIYDVCDSSKPPFDSDCYTYPFDLASEPENVTLKKIVAAILLACNLNHSFTEEEWSRIEKDASEAAKIMTHEVFVQRVAELSPRIEILGEFHGTKGRVPVRCLDCGKEWSPIAASLLRGVGCRSCASIARGVRHRKTDAEFREELSLKHPKIQMVDEYVSSSTPTRFRCLTCEEEWTAKPVYVLSRGVCPHCAKRNRGKKRRNSPESFEERFLETGNPTVALMGTYVSISKTIRVKCKTCGEEWDAHPQSLLRGSGCLKCSGRAQKTPEKFAQEIKEKRSDVELLGQYVNAKTRVLVRCRNCGKEWTPLPPALLNGNAGCSSCARRKVAAKQRRTHSQFLEEMSKMFPTIQVLGTYQNANQKLEVRCSACGYAWQAKPSRFLNAKRGCPQCAN